MSGVGYRCWVDLFPFPWIEGSGASALTVQTTRDTRFRAPFFRHDQDDSISYVYQMRHDWVVGSAVRPHIHVIPHGAAGGVVVFSGEYAWTQIGEGQVLPPLAGWTTFRVTRTVLATELFQEIPISIGNVVPPSWAKRSAHLHMHWTRPGSSDAGDTFTSGNPTGNASSNLQLVSADCHILVEAPGSLTEFGD